MSINPKYYGLVKQIGPWKTTRQDILNGQSYTYTPNYQDEDPYTMPSGNGSVYAQYSSQGLIYDATTTPTLVSYGKPKRGKVIKAKKVVLIGEGGVPIFQPKTYAMEQYMQYAKEGVREQILTSQFGPVSPMVKIAGMSSSQGSSPLHAQAGDSPTGIALAEALQSNLSLDPDKMPGIEETVVSRLPEDIQMRSPLGATDEPYGDIESISPMSFADFSEQEKADLTKQALALIEQGYSEIQVKKMLNVK